MKRTKLLRLLDTLQRYCAGTSVRQIEKATGRARATVATDLQSVEAWTGKQFMRRTPGRHSKGETSGLKSAIARVTRVTRETGKGQRAASTRDWHALRTTFVTLALTAGVPIELVRRVTGHATVEVVLKHYFRPDREQFRAALTGALPDVLTGGPAAPKQLTEAETKAEELDALYGKVKAGSATKEEKKLFRKLSNL